MSCHLRIHSDARNLHTVLRGWQARHHTGGAIHVGPPGVVLLGGDTPVGALEELLRTLEPSEVEMVWRTP